MRAIPYEPARRADLWRLMEDVWGSYVSQEDFDWWFERNPAGPRVVTLAEEDGRVGGVLALSFARMLVAGEERLAAVAVHGATHAEARGRGVFQLLNHENERLAREGGADLVFGFTNASAGPIYIAKLGWIDVAAPRYWMRPLRPLAALRARRGGASRPPALRPGRGLDRFGPDAESTWRETAARSGSQLVRDERYLNWRYAESPRGYRILARGRSFLVLGAKEHGGLSAGFVADLIAPPNAFAETRALLLRALREVDADVVFALPPATGAQRRAYLSVGFVPTPQTIRVIAKALAPRLPLPVGTSRWHLQLGDTDFF